MKIAGMNITYRRFPFEMFLDAMVHLDIEAIELWAGAPHLYIGQASNSEIRNIKRSIKERGLTLCCLTPEQCMYPFNIAAADRKLRELSIDYFKACIYTAVELEVSLVLLTSGLGYFSEVGDEPWKRSADSIAQIAEVAQRVGITLAFEPLTPFESNIITDLKGLARMMAEIQSPALKAMIDTVAMYLARETVEEYLKAFGPDLVHFHLIDGDGSSDAHLAPGDGVLPLQAYIKALRDAAYSGYMTLEIMNGDSPTRPTEALQRACAWLEGI
ncbi:endonuclease [Ktedonosporobacter rubrisoli]|uniref:Endonuclease n=1 Tax=Ktedonosporobacter rubrisoli TaxID=2509675 RepID=A0A4P6JPC9_KTERU|nr:TIM barrel protein [Ktedonosporobacter rubrisoli]QBD76990.1 endonuclease [Ktedonosporobacter rubrisoli]